MKKIILKLVFIIFAALYIDYKIDFAQVVEVISNLDIFYIVAAGISLLISQTISAIRQQVYFASKNCPLKFYESQAIYFRSCFANLYLPSGIGGDVIKIFSIAKKKNVAKKILLQATLSERASGLLALFFFLALFSSLYFLTYSHLIILAFFFVLIYYSFITKWFLNEKLDTSLKALPLSLLVQLFSIITAIMIMKSLFVALAVHAIPLIIIFLISSIVSILPISISGIGLREVSFIYLSPFFTINDEIGLVIASLYYFINMMLFGFIGLILYYFQD